MSKYILPTLFLIFAAFALYYALRHFYFAIVKSYTKEISVHLSDKELSIAKRRKPRKEDWEKGPFTQPPKLRVGTGTIQVGGFTLMLNEDKYIILETNERLIIWLKVTTRFPSKPKLEFRTASVKSNPMNEE